MPDADALDGLLKAANWAAVDLAQKQGPAALPALENAAKSDKYDTRQIAMACAAKIPGDRAGSILAAGLSDPDLNVRLQAANALVLDPPASAKSAIVARLASEPDDRVKEALAIAAGFVPAGEPTPPGPPPQTCRYAPRRPRRSNGPRKTG